MMYYVCTGTCLMIYNCLLDRLLTIYSHHCLPIVMPMFALLHVCSTDCSFAHFHVCCAMFTTLHIFCNNCMLHHCMSIVLTVCCTIAHLLYCLCLQHCMSIVLTVCCTIACLLCLLFVAPLHVYCAYCMFAPLHIDCTDCMFALRMSTNVRIFVFRSNIRIRFLNSNIHIFICPCAVLLLSFQMKNYRPALKGG